MLKLFYLLQARVQAVELQLSQKIQKKLDEPYGSSVFYFSLIVSNLLLVLYQIGFDLLKFVIILTRDPGVSFNIFFKQRELRSCPFSYHSYKGIQQRVRMFSLAGVSAMVIVAVVSSVITNLLFGGKNPTSAATKNFVQESWSGGVSAGYATMSSWTKYDSASSTINFASNNLSLNLVSSSSVRTSEADFLAGTFSTTATTTGSGGVRLEKLNLGLRALYHLNSTTTDASGNGNNLSMVAPVGEKIVNGGFETANTSGWVTSNTGGIYSSAAYPYNLKCGTYFSVHGPGAEYYQDLYFSGNPVTLNFKGKSDGGNRTDVYIDSTYIGQTTDSSGTFIAKSLTFTPTSGLRRLKFVSVGGNGTQTAYGLDCVSMSDNLYLWNSEGKFGGMAAKTVVSGRFTTNISLGSNWTTAGWVDFSATGNGTYKILTQSSSATDSQIAIRNSDRVIGTIVAGTFNPSGYAVTSDAGWHHLAAVGESGQTKIYIDGSQVGSTIAAQSTSDITSIGNGSDGNSPFGEIDDLMIYTRALSGQDIAGLASMTDEYDPSSNYYVSSGTYTSVMINLGQKTTTSSLSWVENSAGANTSKFLISSSNETYSDNFDLASISSARWNSYNNYGTNSIESGRLKITSVTGSSSWPNVSLKSAFAGDFDVQSDYDINGLSAGSGKNVLIRAGSSPKQWQCQVFIGTNNPTLGGYTDDTTGTSLSSYVPEKTGKLRMTRASNIINCYVLDADTNDWINFHRFSSGSYISGNMTLGLYMSDTDSAANTETAYFDNFIVWGNNSGSTNGSYFGSDGQAHTDCSSGCYDTSGTQLNSIHNNSQYFRYKTFLSTGNSAATPSLDSVSFNYSNYPTSASLISSPYNSGSLANMLALLKWYQNITATNTAVKLQLATAPDSGSGTPGTWSSWLGPTSASDYYTSAVTNGLATGQTINPTHATTTGNQWFRYKVTLESDGTASPTLTGDSTKGVIITYVVNEPPEVSSVAAAQISDPTSPNYGKVVIDFAVKDIDSTTDLITPSYEYSIDGGSSWQPITSNLSSGATSATTTSTSTPIAHQVVWDAKQLLVTDKITNAKIKVTANDGDAALNIGTASSDNFILDTRAPVASNLRLVATTTTPNLYFAATDSSTMEVRFSANLAAYSNFSATDNTGWQAYASSSAIALTDPGTAYVQYRDLYGNTTATSTVTTPETPQSFMVQDTSNIKDGLTDYRLFIAWRTISTLPNAAFAAYEVYKSTDGSNFSLDKTLTSVADNYYIDDAVVFDTPVYFKVAVRDQLSNTSFFTETIPAQANGTQDPGEGGGGSGDGAPTPVIEADSVASTTNTTQATISWNTGVGQFSDSVVEYATTQEGLSNANSVGVASMRDRLGGALGQHSVTITGLEPATPYYFRVRSTNADGVSASSTARSDSLPYSFTTLSGPVITQIATSTPTNTSITISWRTVNNLIDNTDYPANAYVVYSTASNLANSIELGTASESADHSITLTGLTPGTPYYYFVKSNEARDDNGGGNLGPNGYYRFETTQDLTPTSLGPVSQAVTDTQATLSWQTINPSTETAEPATTTVRYKKSTDSGYTSLVNDSLANLNADHSITITSLDPDADYEVVITCADQNGNASAPVTVSLHTSAAPDTSAPTITTAADLISDTNPTRTTISWTTNEAASSYVQYAAATSTFETDFKEVGRAEATTTHQVIIEGLVQDRVYYFRLKSSDPSGNTSYNPVQADPNYHNFTTVAGPDISNVASSTAETTATITWSTIGAASDSYVVYSLCSDQSNPQQTGTGNLTQSHSVNLTGLLPQSTYCFKVSSRKANGGSTTDDNGGASYVFNTVATELVISNVASSTTDTTALISWTTSRLADSKIVFGQTSGSYPESQTNTTNTIDHSILLSSLASSTTHYFRVISTDELGRTATSSEYSFRTQAAKIDLSEYQQKANEIEQLKTELAAATSSSQVSQTEASVLQQKIQSLEQQLVTAKQASSGGGVLIIDKTDKVAPAISNVQVTDVRADGAVISWLTNEEAGSFVNYLGRSLNKTLGEFNSLKNHLVRLDNLTPDTRYTYKALSVDNSGNLATSPEYSFTTLSLAAQLSAEGKTPEEVKQQLTELENSQPENKEQLLIAAAKKAMEIVSNVASEVSLGVLENTLTSQFDSLEKLASAIPAPILGGEPGVAVGVTTAQITWKTDKDSNSLVAFSPEAVYDLFRGTAKAYQQVAGNHKDKAKNHLVTITDLKPDTIYHYQLRSEAELGPEAKSRDFTFKTKPETLEISNYATQNATTEKAIFKWITNQETDSELTYVPYRNNKLAVDEAKTFSDKSLTTIHEITIDKFEAGVIYQVIMAGTDQKGSKITKTIETFSTSEDDLPPIISQVQTESALSQGKQMKVQTVISWLTNEPTIGQVMYEKGVITGDQEFKERTTLETTYGRKHVAIITKFEPGAVYTFRVNATDSGGNSTISKTFTILTPRQKESVFQLILKNFESTFGWVSKIK